MTSGFPVLGIDPGENAGYALCSPGGAIIMHQTDSPTWGLRLHEKTGLPWFPVIAVEDQWATPSRKITRVVKGRKVKITINQASLITLAFRAGLAIRFLHCDLLLRVQPKTWRRMLWDDAQYLPKQVGINRLVRDLELDLDPKDEANHDRIEACGVCTAVAKMIRQGCMAMPGKRRSCEHGTSVASCFGLQCKKVKQ